MIIKQPSMSQELGLQLSLVTSLGLCICTCPDRTLHNLLDERLSGGQRSTKRRVVSSFIRMVKLNLRVSFTAWLMTAPILSWHLGELSLLSPIMNAVLTPIISILVIPVGLIVALISPISSFPLEVMVMIINPLAEWATGINDQFFPIIVVGRSFTYSLACLSVAWILASLIRSVNPLQQSAALLKCPQMLLDSKYSKHQDLGCLGRRLKAIVTLCLGTSIMLCDRDRVAEPHVSFLSVGQGDATWIDNGHGQIALFDVGPARASTALIRRLKVAGIQRIDWVAISHLHPDHYGSLLDLMEEIPVTQVIYHGRAVPDSHSWQMVLNKAEALGTSVIMSRQGVYRWGELTLTWLFSQPHDALKENDASLAILVDGLEQSVLLSGDLEVNGEKRLRQAWQDLGRTRPLDIWQVNHHGSATSTEVETLNMVAPNIAIISSDGAHRFALPHPQTLKRLSDQGVKWYRVDLEGDIIYPLKYLNKTAP